jgi:alpha/beta superfamily hydrolase
MLLTIPGPVGPLEALLDTPAAPPRAAVVFAHPHPVYGGTMHTRGVYYGAKGLVRSRCAVLRFNFRGVGTSAGEFDQGRGEVDDFRAALNEMHERYPGIPLWTAGFSFGAWVALETGATDPRVSALIGIAPPVAGHGFSFPHTLDSTKPKFFVQGDLDELCLLKDLRTFYARLQEPKDLVIIDGASHLFDGQATEVGEALEDLMGDIS